MLARGLMSQQLGRAARFAVLLATTSACFGGGCLSNGGGGGDGCKDAQLSGSGDTSDTCTPAGGRCVTGWLFQGCAAEDVVDETCPNPSGSIFGGGVCCRPSPRTDGGAPSCAAAGGTCVPYAECPGHLLAPACAGPDVCCSTAGPIDAGVGSCGGVICEPGCACRPLVDLGDAAADAADAADADAGPRFGGAGDCTCPAGDAGDGGDAAIDAGVYACGVVTCIEGCTCADPSRSLCVCP